MSVADLERPVDVEPGWKLDPLGVGVWRWWNGEKWLLETAGETTDAHTFWSRIKSLPAWAMIGIPIAGVAIAYFEYQSFSGGSWFELVWWLSPGI